MCSSRFSLANKCRALTSTHLFVDSPRLVRPSSRSRCRISGQTLWVSDFCSYPFLSRCDQMVQHAISSGVQIVFVAVFEVLVKGWNKNPWVWRHWRPSYHCQQNRAGLHHWRGYLHWRYCLVLAVLLWGTNNPRRLCDDISHCLISPTSWEVDSSLPVDGRSSRWGKISRSFNLPVGLCMLAFVLLTCEQKGCFTGFRAPSAAASINYDKGGQGAAFSAWELPKGLVSAV